MKGREREIVYSFFSDSDLVFEKNKMRVLCIPSVVFLSFLIIKIKILSLFLTSSHRVTLDSDGDM